MVARRVSRRCRARVRLFLALRTIEPAIKRRLRDRARQHQVWLAFNEEWRTQLTFLLVVIPGTIGILLSMFFAVTLGLRWWFPSVMNGPARNWDHLPLNVIGFVLGYFVFLGPLYLVLFITKRMSYAALLGWPMLLGVVGAPFVARVSTATWPSPFVALSLTAAFLGGLGLWVILVGVLLGEVAVKYFFSRRAAKIHPDSVVFDALLTTLVTAENDPWTALDTRWRLLRGLEEVADCIERDLPRRLPAGDATTASWVRVTLSEKASAIRALKRWVSTPKPDTAEHFAARIATTLTQVAADDWDALERVGAEAEGPGRVLDWRKRVAAWTRTGGTALTPAAVWWALQRSPLASKGPVAEYVAVGVGVWAVVTVLAEIDPLFGAKVGALKDASSVFLPRKRD